MTLSHTRYKHLKFVYISKVNTVLHLNVDANKAITEVFSFLCRNENYIAFRKKKLNYNLSQSCSNDIVRWSNQNWNLAKLYNLYRTCM